MLDEFQSHDYKEFWHQFIEQQLDGNICKYSWFYLLPIFKYHADIDEKLIKIITHNRDLVKQYKTNSDDIKKDIRSSDQRNETKKWSI